MKSRRLKYLTKNYAIAMACEDAIMATNDDAAQCKRFVVEKGYWVDPYISLLVPKGKSIHAPEINRGYYARVMGIRNLIQKFVEVIKVSQPKYNCL